MDDWEVGRTWKEPFVSDLLDGGDEEEDDRGIETWNHLHEEGADHDANNSLDVHQDVEVDRELMDATVHDMNSHVEEVVSHLEGAFVGSVNVDPMVEVAQIDLEVPRKGESWEVEVQIHVVGSVDDVPIDLDEEAPNAHAGEEVDCRSNGRHLMEAAVAAAVDFVMTEGGNILLFCMC